MGFTISDVFTKAMVDYDGELRAQVTLQITDKDNTPNPGGPGATAGSAATTTEIPLEMVAPCSPTVNLPDEGSSCTVSTTADTLVPGTVKEGRRTDLAAGRGRGLRRRGGRRRRHARRRHAVRDAGAVHPVSRHAAAYA